MAEQAVARNGQLLYKLEVIVLLQQGLFFHSDCVLVVAFYISNT